MTWVVDLARQRAAEEPSPPLFGVIVYTDWHVHIKKILRDEDYWRAFDELTGPRWDVFSIRAHDGVWSAPSAPSRSFAMMRTVWKEPEANRELVDAFELDDTSDLPAVVIFHLAGKDLSRTVVRIDDSNFDNAYESLKSVFVKVAAAWKAFHKLA
jgi:hypothetical protein